MPTADWKLLLGFATVGTALLCHLPLSAAESTCTSGVTELEPFLVADVSTPVGALSRQQEEEIKITDNLLPLNRH